MKEHFTLIARERKKRAQPHTGKERRKSQHAAAIHPPTKQNSILAQFHAATTSKLSVNVRDRRERNYRPNVSYQERTTLPSFPFSPQKTKSQKAQLTTTQQKETRSWRWSSAGGCSYCCWWWWCDSFSQNSQSKSHPHPSHHCNCVLP